MRVQQKHKDIQMMASMYTLNHHLKTLPEEKFWQCSVALSLSSPWTSPAPDPAELLTKTTLGKPEAPAATWGPPLCLLLHFQGPAMP